MKCPVCSFDNGADVPIKSCRCGYTAFSPTVAQLSHHGPGHEVEKMKLDWLAPRDCNCKDMARQMDKWGPDGCDENRDCIERHFLRHAKESWLLKYAPGKREGARQIISLAIKRARHNAWDGGSQGDWVTVMTTAPRRNPTIVESVNSLRTAGWEPIVFAEPGSIATNCRTIENEEKLGCWHNWLSSVRWTLEHSSASVIMTVQDDGLFHPDCRSFAESLLWPSADTGILSLYTNKFYGKFQDGADRPAGVHQIHTVNLWGALALIWPRRVLERAVESRTAHTWVGARVKSGNREVVKKRKANPSMIANSDTAIGKMLSEQKRKLWFVLPSPVYHLAKFSAVGHGTNKGVRNCHNCADHERPLSEQCPLPQERIDVAA